MYFSVNTKDPGMWHRFRNPAKGTQQSLVRTALKSRQRTGLSAGLRAAAVVIEWGLEHRPRLDTEAEAAPVIFSSVYELGLLL